MFLKPVFPSRALGAALLLCAAAAANDRHFGYTYETATMPKGNRELEVWTTARTGRDDFYSRLDQRMEFETGLTDNLQTAFYLNWRQITSEDATGGLVTGFDWKGISSEWKYKLSDPSADALGFALYGEIGYNTDGLELEGKLLFDKQAGPLLLAANLICEFEYEAEAAEMELEEIAPEVILSAAYQFSPALSLGLELRNHNAMVKQSGGEDMELEYAALFLGPTAAYAAKGWWATFTLLPQIPGFKSSGAGLRELNDHEAMETRLLFSFHL